MTVNVLAALNKLCKWRTVLAGWHNGTQSIETAGNPAMRDLMDKWLIMRVETTTLTALLLDKGLVTQAEYQAQIVREAALLDQTMEEFFDGFRSTDHGLEIFDIQRANAMMAKRKFPA
jgi:citrate synthase